MRMVKRMVGHAPRGSAFLWLALAAAMVVTAPVPALAQVGHAPTSSPYRDIRKGHSITVTYGHFGGDGGDFGIGPHDGPIYGIHYDIRTSGTIMAGLGVARGDLQRLIVDPFVERVNRVSGPVDQTVTFADFNLQFNITGGKTWHRLAPF